MPYATNIIYQLIYVLAPQLAHVCTVSHQNTLHYTAIWPKFKGAQISQNSLRMDLCKVLQVLIVNVIYFECLPVCK